MYFGGEISQAPHITILEIILSLFLCLSLSFSFNVEQFIPFWFCACMPTYFPTQKNKWFFVDPAFFGVEQKF